MGAGPEAWSAGQSLGFTYDQTISYDVLDVHDHKAAFAAVSASNTLTTSGMRGMSASYAAAAPAVKSSLENKSGVTPPKNYKPDDGDDGDPS